MMRVNKPSLPRSYRHGGLVTVLVHDHQLPSSSSTFRQAGSIAVLERGREPAGDRGLRPKGHRAGRFKLRRPGGPDRHLRNDGTLWVEQPLYVQVLFAADEMKAGAAQHPEWSAHANFQKVIKGDANAILQLAPADQFQVAFAVHSGLTADDYAAHVRQWLSTHRHPKLNRPYTQLAYQPMLELIAYLRANEFQVYSATGSEIGFVREVNELAFGIPRDHVLGTLLKSKFDGSVKPAQLLALPDVLLIDDGDGKPISIQNAIGRRPIATFGNSDGDLSMLQWTASGAGARLSMLVHHDDAEREFAYDRTSPVGHLDKALDAAAAQGWKVLSMKSDWKRVFAER